MCSELHGKEGPETAPVSFQNKTENSRAVIKGSFFRSAAPYHGTRDFINVSVDGEENTVKCMRERPRPLCDQIAPPMPASPVDPQDPGLDLIMTDKLTSRR